MTVPVRPVVRKPRLRFPALRRARKALSSWTAGLNRSASPRARTLMFAAALVALLAVIVFALVRLGAGVDLRAMEQDRTDSGTGKLDASSVAQSFRSPRDNLSSVNVLLDGYN